MAFPHTYMDRTLRDRTGTLIAGQSTGSFSTEGGTVSNIVDVAEVTFTFEMTDTYGDGICCQYGASRFKATVNGEPIAISSSGEFRDVVRESFDVVRRSASPPSTIDWMSYTKTTRMGRFGCYRVSRPVL